MKQRGGSVRVASPLRVLAQRFSLPILAAAAFCLIAFGKADFILAERARVAAADALAPVLDMLARPSTTLTGALETAHDLLDVHTENLRLREERAQLLHWQTVAAQLADENDQLRKQLQVIADPQIHLVSARVISDTGSSYLRTVLTGAGTREGVEKGQAALTGDGLAGRVQEVGERSSRILLLTDINSRVPVVVERTREDAVVAGNNSDEPQLLYLLPGASIQAGDRLVTSGVGGLFPPGLAVGTVSSVKDGLVLVRPFADIDRMEFVSLARYELPKPPAPARPVETAAR